MERSKYNLVDIDFNSFSPEEKRLGFIVMDVVMKDKHKHNKKIISFNPQDIYYDIETKLFDFNVTDINSYVADSKEAAVSDDILGLANLAFCSYLKTYDPKDGLLNHSVIASEFENFKDNFYYDDVDYYREVLVTNFKNGTNNTKYYSDEVIKKEQEKSASGMSDNRVLSYATEAGRLLTDRTDEAAFSNTFYMACMVTASMIAVVGLIIYILSTL